MNRPIVDNALLAACGRMHNVLTAFWAVLLFGSLGGLWYLALGFHCGGVNA